MFCDDLHRPVAYRFVITRQRYKIEKRKTNSFAFFRELFLKC